MRHADKGKLAAASSAVRVKERSQVLMCMTAGMGSGPGEIEKYPLQVLVKSYGHVSDNPLLRMLHCPCMRTPDPRPSTAQEGRGIQKFPLQIMPRKRFLQPAPQI